MPGLHATKVAKSSDVITNNLTCPICHEGFIPGHDLVACPECKSPYHLKCWTFNNNQCAQLGCSGRGTVGAVESIVSHGPSSTGDEKLKEGVPIQRNLSNWGTAALVGLFGSCIGVLGMLIVLRMFGGLGGQESDLATPDMDLAVTPVATVAENETKPDFASVTQTAVSQTETAMAAWLDQDDDRDGLTNGMELELNTLPNKRDTDEDGLEDLDEQEYGTNPLDDDTDKDGLKDGEEIRMETNPLGTDTDGDGLSDTRDPDPDQPPTPTSTLPPPPPTHTSTPTLSPPTSTPSPTLTPPPPTSTPSSTPLPPPASPTPSFPVLEWVSIPAGSFTMGSSEAEILAALADCSDYENNCQADWFRTESPQGSVWLDVFQITRYEVTNAQYNVCVEFGPCPLPRRASSDNSVSDNGGYFRSDYPVVTITADDANLFCRWLNGRLPSEAEWEKAARGTDSRRYPWGNSLDTSRANLYSGYPNPVGSYPSGASPYGVMDMAGNVAEFTSGNVVRGGSWKNFPYQGRTAQRSTGDWLTKNFTNYDIGFRCVR